MESRAFAFTESPTDLREVIHGVIALLDPLACRRDLRLRACVDQSVAETILADGARLGQLVFHLLNRTIQRAMPQEIVLVVRARPLNSNSQRIFISVVCAPLKVVPAAIPPAADPAIEDPQMPGSPGDADACLPLCRILAQRMRGELVLSNGSDTGSQAIFNAPFCVEGSVQALEAPRTYVEAPLFARASQRPQHAPSASFEPFDPRYLDALSKEGVDLQAFLDNWRVAMSEDLERLNGLLCERRFDRLHSVLHRLSGAVGLVGARSLMEALRRASISPSDHTGALAEALMARAKTLVTQLDTTARAYRSTSP